MNIAQIVDVALRVWCQKGVRVVRRAVDVYAVQICIFVECHCGNVTERPNHTISTQVTSLEEAFIEPEVRIADDVDIYNGVEAA